MATTADQPGAEWSVLEVLCRGADEPARRDAVARLVAGGLHWGELIEQALRHKMLAAVAHLVVTNGLAAHVPERVMQQLRSVLAINRYRRHIWYQHAAAVVAALEKQGVAVAARKGAAYESSLYHGDGRRWLGDIDLLIRPEDAAAAARLMSTLGYEVGRYDFDDDRVVPLERRELVTYRLHPDHLPPHHLVTGDQLVPVIEVDIACSVTWTNAPYQVPTATLLESLVRRPAPGLDGVGLPCLQPGYQFLDTVLHLFREAWIEFWVEVEQDVDLMKFGDVIRLWEAYHEQIITDGFRETVEEYHVVEPVCWVLEHLDRTFDTGVVAQLGLTGRVSEEFLASAGGAGGAVRVWHGRMRDRLYAKSRQALFTELPT